MGKQSLAPVVLIGFSRPDLQRRVLENLCHCDGVQQTDMFAYVDAPVVPRAECDEVKSVFIEYASHKLPRLQLRFRDRHFGCKNNIVDAITAVINQYGKAIIVEDDILVSRTFLTYMNDALKTYRDDKRIFQINGMRPSGVNALGSLSDDVFLVPCTCSWGWGTWADRWNEVDFELKDYKIKRGATVPRNRLEQFVFDLCDAQLEGRVDTWDAQVAYHLIVHDLYAVAPRLSLSKNVGFGINGTHHAYYNPLLAKRKYFNFSPLFNGHLEVLQDVQDACRSFDFAMFQRPPRFTWRWFVKNLLHRYPWLTSENDMAIDLK